MAFGSTSSSSGFIASFENLVQSILHIFASFARSGLAFVQLIFAMFEDMFFAALHLVEGVLGVSFNITKGAANAGFKVGKGTVETGAHATAEVSKGVFGFMEGVIGFVAGKCSSLCIQDGTADSDTGNAVAISLCIAGYYLFTSYQRQTSRGNRADTTTLAKNTIADASSRAQTDVAQVMNKANDTVKGVVNAGAARADAAYDRSTRAAKN